MARHFIILSALLLLGLQSQADFSTRSQACQDFIAQLPTDYDKEFITVPLNHQHPEKGQIQIFVYGKWTTTKDKTAPFIFFNGGPSLYSWSSYKIMAAQLNQTDLNFAYFDQRGNGCSDLYPEITQSEDFEKLSAYSSPYIIEDAEIIRQKFFKRPVNIVGHSFGVRLALRYLSQYPESVKKTFIAGDFLFSEAETTKEVMLGYYKSDFIRNKAAFENFVKVYPKVGENLKFLFNNISQNFCFTGTAGLINVCGYEILNSLAFSLSSDPSKRPAIANLINSFISTEGTIDYSKFDKIKEHTLLIVDPKMEIIASYDYPLVFDGKQICDITIDEMQKAGQANPDWYLDECNIQKKFTRIAPYMLDSKNILTVKKFTELTAGHNISILKYAQDEDYVGGTEFICKNITNDEFKEICKSITETGIHGGHSAMLTNPQFWIDITAP